ncbi:hypothetical protein RHS04_08051 [Rhizoctonia solani]|uniref:BTB domain-containing protein n=1 Tax=Rhizoctonia solani TaxID=456999 RepID=A0A8H7H0I3_9AGAM|nr:hypothetical protein RHS04_08051 [Rhizoctonia solani]
MFSLTTSSNEDGTEEKPVLLPAGLCSSVAFKTICDFIYPESVGIFPTVTIDNLVGWESVLAATSILQMNSTTQCIMLNLTSASSQIHQSEAARFMRLVVDYDTRPLSLATHLVAPLCTFAFRRRPLSPYEFSSMGEKVSALVHYTRESVRDCFLLDQAKWIGNIQTGLMCNQKERCRKAIFQQILENMVNKPGDKPFEDDDESSIFLIASEEGICTSCYPQRSKLAHALMLSMIEGVVKKACSEGASVWNQENLESGNKSEPDKEQIRPVGAV